MKEVKATGEASSPQQKNIHYNPLLHFFYYAFIAHLPIKMRIRIHNTGRDQLSANKKM